MKVFLKPVGLYSHAMVRVAHALRLYAPKGVEVTENRRDADLQIVHVIGPDSMTDVDLARPYAMIQYCLKTAGLSIEQWRDQYWRNSRLVWSYYELPNFLSYYFAPLGVDRPFAEAVDFEKKPRDIAAMTSGYVSSPDAEAIEEPAMAADALGLKVVHLGPVGVEGMRLTPPRWSSVHGIQDYDLVRLYQRTEWVCALRHHEGFELPAIEGLLCGARPIVFDRPDMRQWYDEYVAYVPECHGDELVEHLTEIFRHKPTPVADEEKERLRERFNWKTIATGFWERAL
jgi:glycosyltransferase involved in cell wall biosynthesis